MNRLLRRLVRRVFTSRNRQRLPVREHAVEKTFHLPEISLNDLIGERVPQAISILCTQVQRPRDMVLPLSDLMALAAICKTLSPRRVMEIGTFTGETTWTMAHNLPLSSEILTLDLPPDEIPANFQRYVAGEAFQGTPEAKQINQLYGWSERFDFTPYYGTIDLIFIDGDHTYDAVRNDTAQALKLVKPGGIVIWDDYRYLPCHEGCRGVSDYLHSVVSEMPVKQLTATRLAVMKVA